MNVTFNEQVSQRSAGQVLHRFLALCFREVSLDWPSHIKQGGVTVDGRPADPDQLIEAGQVLVVSLSDYHEKPVNTEWRILWQGEELLAVHKPAGLPVHRTPMHIYNTLVELVRRESEWHNAHLLHRLDADTAGIVLLGKDNAAAAKWQPKISQLMQRKIYHAVVYGKPQWREQDFQCELTMRDNSEIRAQMYVCEEGETGKFSHTHFRYLRGNERYSIIECEIFTGRKHQIRTHLAYLGHAIVGDKIYSNDGEYYLRRLQKKLTPQDEIQLKTPQHLLFAHKVTLQSLPNTTEQVDIEDSFFPPQWLQFCEEEGL